LGLPCKSARRLTSNWRARAFANLMARLDQLGDAKPVVQTAAALGREFSDERSSMTP